VADSSQREEENHTTAARSTPSSTPPASGAAKLAGPPIIVAAIPKSTTFNPPCGSKPTSHACAIEATAANAPERPKTHARSTATFPPSSATRVGLSASARNSSPLSAFHSHAIRADTAARAIIGPTTCARARVTEKMRHVSSDPSLNS